MASVSFPVKDSDREYLKQFTGGTVTLVKNAISGIAVITLDYPEKRNALSGEMMVKLCEKIEELESWADGKGVILRGKGGNFCSGGDLNFARAAGNIIGAQTMSTWMLHTLRRLSDLQLLTVCIIEGPTLGGGAEISVACDFIIASNNVKYGFVHGKMGIITAWGGTTRLANKIGDSKALDLLLTSKILSAEDCLSLGIADAKVSSENALNEVEQWLDARLQHDISVIKAYKKIISMRKELRNTENYQFERDTFLPFWGGQINQEALLKKSKHIE